mmetsp:Transcript_88417/g.166622  ORF Transcript_88417/g.166622 Transcript_88417/m.166622 type:complete len:84 (+) Transcript_88417:384-635(+)
MKFRAQNQQSILAAAQGIPTSFELLASNYGMLRNRLSILQERRSRDSMAHYDMKCRFSAQEAHMIEIQDCSDDDTSKLQLKYQ